MNDKEISNESIPALPEGAKDISESVQLFDDAFFKQEARKLSISYDLTRRIRFDVAFKMWDSFKEWQDRNPHSKMGHKYFLREYIKAGDLKQKEKNLRAAFYVAKVFPDLETISNRKKSFECYRGIATARLSQETKESLRTVMEQVDDIKSPQVKRMIKEAKKNEGKEIKEDSEQNEAEITFKDMAQFQEKFKKTLNPSAGMRFRIKVIRKNSLVEELE